MKKVGVRKLFMIIELWNHNDSDKCSSRYREKNKHFVINGSIAQYNTLSVFNSDVCVSMPKASWRDTIQKDILGMDLVWSVEEAEVAAKDRRIWKHISCQAEGAGMPDAIQK